MALENGEWILHGADWDSPDRIRSWQELIEYVDAVGFLPLFKNEVEGFSVEEKTSPLFWWTGDPKQDPWEWRAIIARSEKVAYGKFFNKKAGFISLRWFPYFANYRRDGYDFDARWEDGLSGYRSKKIMDLFEVRKEYPSYELKKRCRLWQRRREKFQRCRDRASDADLSGDQGFQAEEKSKRTGLRNGGFCLCHAGRTLGI